MIFFDIINRMQALFKKITEEFKRQMVDRLWVHRDGVNIAQLQQAIWVLIGPRRSGKTTLLVQAMQSFAESGIAWNRLFYINFEDDRLDSISQDNLESMLDAFREIRGGYLNDCFLFFDEIQLAPNWEKFVRRVFDSVCPNIWVTGSNATMLSTEIASTLRGRAIVRQVFPFSYREFCRYRHSDPSAQNLLEYLNFGGFPQIIAAPDPHIKINLLQNFYHTMLVRDVVERYDLSSVKMAKLALHQFAYSSGRSMAIKKFHNTLKSAGLDISINTLHRYEELFANAYAIVVIHKFHTKPLQRRLGDRKPYLIDTGYMTALVDRDDLGHRLEHAVLHQLIRAEASEITFFKTPSGVECDFIVTSRGIHQAIQVCWDLDDPATYDREIKGLISACQALGLQSGVVVTPVTMRTLSVDGIEVHILPFFTWADSQ